MESLTEYLDNIYTFVTDYLLIVTPINRIGLAIVSYINHDDKTHKYWMEKYKLPFGSHSTSEIHYIINNPFIKGKIN
jgi:hypothetical protein